MSQKFTLCTLIYEVAYVERIDVELIIEVIILRQQDEYLFSELVFYLSYNSIDLVSNGGVFSSCHALLQYPVIDMKIFSTACMSDRAILA